MLKTTKNFNNFKKINELTLKEKIFNSIFRISHIENNKSIHQLLFNNKDLTVNDFANYSYISQSLSSIIVKFNKIKNEKYFRNLMKKIISKFTLDNIITVLDNFNENISTDFESMLYFLELIKENFNEIKHLKINTTLFRSLIYLSKINKDKNKIFDNPDFQKLVINIFYLLLNTKGQLNPKNCNAIFEQINMLLNMINNKDFLLQIFYVFFVELIDNKNKSHILENTNYDYFSDFNIIKLDHHHYNYLKNIIQSFEVLEPQINIINILIKYFNEIFFTYYKIFLLKSQNEDISIDTKEKDNELFIICSFHHIFPAKQVYYVFYSYLIKYSKLNNNKKITELFPVLKAIIMSIYDSSQNPFYLEIIIKILSNLDKLEENVIYIKEILDLILELDFNQNLNNSLKNKLIISNTIQLLQIFFCASKEQKICEALVKYGLFEYILKFFEKLKKNKFIFSSYCLQMNINGKIYQKTILEICFSIAISIILSADNENIKKKFFDFFCLENIEVQNHENKIGKSLAFFLDINNREKLLNDYKDIKKYLIEDYNCQDLSNYFLENNCDIGEKSILVEFILYLIKIKYEKNLDNNMVILNENSYIEKYINLFINDLLLLVNDFSGFKKTKKFNRYNSIIDLINKIKKDEIYATKAGLLSIFDKFCKEDKINNTEEKINIKNLNLYNKSIDECPLKEKCLILVDNEVEESSFENQYNSRYEIIKSFFNIENKNLIKCLKKDLLLKNCSIYFENIFFSDKNFKNIKNSFYYNYETFLSKEAKEDSKNLFLNYPSKLKNFSSNKYAMPKIFLSPNIKIYQNIHFSLLYPKINKNLINNNFPSLPSHYIYYSELLKNNIQRPISPINLNTIECELIMVKYTIFGKIIFYPNYFVFKSQKTNENILKEYETNLKYIFSSGIKELQLLDKILLIRYDEIEEIFSRCFVYISQATEIFLTNGKSYFFNFIEEKNLKNFYEKISYLNEGNSQFKIINNPKKEFENLGLTKKWENGEITNEQYLLYLNKYSGRSYNDYNQYPIFPWVTLSKNYFSDKIKNEENNIVYRYMNYFMQTQTENGRNDALFCYNNSIDESPKNPKHFRIHYSTGGFILLYLMRIFPFMEQHIKLQGNNFDNPCRMMHSIEEFLNIIRDSKDNRELIPEFFTSIEYFINLNYVYFGKRHINEIVNNLLAPEINLCHKKLINFIYYNKIFLNNRIDGTYKGNINLEKCKINNWIDLIFGYKQYPKDLKSLNAFEKTCNRLSFSILNSLKKLKDKKVNNKTLIAKMNAKKLKVLYFGQTPEQLFESKHCKYESNQPIKGYNNEYKLSELYSINIRIITFWLSENKSNFFFLIKNTANKNMYIYIYDENLKKKYEVNIGKIKLYSIYNITNKRDMEIKIKKKETNKSFKRENTFMGFSIVDKSKSKPIKYKDLTKFFCLSPRNGIIEFFDEYNDYFFVGRNKDNTIKIYDKNNKIKGIIKLNSFVSVLYKKNKNIFLSGHMDGKLIEWIIKENNNLKQGIKSIYIKREIKAHNNSLITDINYNEKHNIILTSDINGILYIRKYCDFELLTKIKIKEEKSFVTQIFLNDFNLIYTINYDSIEHKKYICLFSLNGILLEKSDLHSIIDSYILNNGKIIFNRLEELDLFMFGFNKIKEGNKGIICDNTLKKIDFKDFKHYDSTTSFVVKGNQIYILLNNCIFINGCNNSLNLVCYGIN